MPVILDIGVNNAELRAGLQQAESMVDAAVKRITVRMNKAGQFTGATMAFAAPEKMAAQSTALGLVATRMEKVTAATGGLNSALGRMTGIFSGGLGISAAIGGLSLLGAAFTRGIQKAQEFQTAQLSINAILLSTYKVQQNGKTLTGPAAFSAAQAESQKLNQWVIERSRKNILTYQEQLAATQTAIAIGGRKGLTPESAAKIGEELAVAAKALNIHGQRISEQVRVLLGGGVNVSRSVLARSLNVKSADVANKTGPELVQLLEGRLKGFKDPGVVAGFNESIQKIITTMQSQIDVFLAKVGTKTMGKLKGPLDEFGKFLEGQDSEKLGDALVTGFTNIFKAIELIAKSPAIPLIEKFITFLAGNADKIIIGTVLLKIAGIVAGLIGGVTDLSGRFLALGKSAAVAAEGVNGLAVAEERANVAGSGRSGGFGTVGAGVEGALLSPAQQAAIQALMARGTPQAEAQARNLAKGMYGRRVELGQAAAGQEAGLEELAAGGSAAAGGLGLGAKLKGFGGKALGFGSSMLGKALPAAFAAGLIEFGGGSTGISNPNQRTDKLTYGGVGTDVAAGAVGGAMVAGVPGAIVGATAGLIKSLLSALGRAKAIADDANTALADFTKKHPLASKMAKVAAAEAHAKEMARIPALEVEGKTHAQWVAEAKYWEGERQKLYQQNAEVKKKAATFKSVQSGTDDLDKTIKENEAAAKQAGEDYGPQAQIHKATFEFNKYASEIKKSRDTRTLSIVDEDLAAAQKSGKMSDTRVFDTQAHRLIERGRQKMLDTQESARIKHKEALELGDNDQSIEAQYRKGLRGVQRGVIAQREELGADFAPTMKKAVANFNESFDMRGKQIEEQIKGMDLGVKSEHVGEDIRLSFLAAIHKIDMALKEHSITQAEALARTAEIKNETQAKVIEEAYKKSRRLGLVDTAISNVRLSEYGRLETMAGVTGAAPLTTEAYGLLQKLEEAKKSGKFTPKQYEDYRTQSIEAMQQKIGYEAQMKPLQEAQQRMAVPQAQAGLASAWQSSAMYEANLNPDNADVMKKAQEWVGRHEGTRLNMNEAIAVVEEQVRLQREANAMAIRKAEIDLQLAEVEEQLRTAMLKQISTANDVATAQEALKRNPPGTTSGGPLPGYHREQTPGGYRDVLDAQEAIKAKENLDAQEAKKAKENPVFNIDVGTGGFTEKDIDRWIPAIREKLCKLAAQSGSRG